MNESTSLPPVTALVLCGGRARRLGGVDKGLYPLLGRPLVEHVLERIAPQVGDIVISANRSVDSYQVYGHPVFGDLTGSYDGPLAGVLSGLQNCASAWMVCVPCDAPDLPSDLVPRLLRAALDADVEVAAASDGDRLQPTFALYRRALVEPLAVYLETGGRKIDRFFESRRFATVDFSDQPQAFVNINSADDARAFSAAHPVPVDR
jgi:molybdopterin-guanine dinucleotide biosynthesis protein A